jgi:hypothetical protein
MITDLRDYPTDAADKVADKAKGPAQPASGAASSVAHKVEPVASGKTGPKAADRVKRPPILALTRLWRR